jgi:putative transposase
MYIKVEGLSVTLPTGGKGNKNKRYPDVIAKLTEEAPPDYKDVAISRDGQGHYYASFVHEEKESMHEHDGVLAIDLGIKTLATGVNEQGRIYHVGGFKGHRWYNKQLDKIRSKRDRCKKKSRRYIHLSKVYKRVSQKKRNKQRDSLHKASHLISHTLVERTVVVGDLSQRQMVIKEHSEHKKRRNKQLNRAVFNNWELYSFVQMLRYKCVLYGKELAILDERDTSKMCSSCGKKQAMPLYKRTYRCANTDCRLVMDRDENSAVNMLKRYLARLGPHGRSRAVCGCFHRN